MSRLFWILVAGLVLFAPAPRSIAQQGEQGDEADRIRRQVDRRVEQLRRGLELSDGQVEKLRPILESSEGEQQRLRKQNEEKILQLLTPEQRERYEGLQRRRGRGGSGGSGGSRRFGAGRIMERLQEQLDLTPEQEGKLQAIFDKGQEEMRAVFTKAREGGFQNMDWSKIRETMTTYWEQLSDKVRAELNEDQKSKYEELVKEMENSPWMRGFEGRGSREQRSNQPRGDRNRGERSRRDPAEVANRRFERAMEALELSEEEAAVVGPLVRRVLDLQTVGRKPVTDVREGLAKLLTGGQANDQQLQEAMEAIRTARSSHEKQVDEAREELRGLLTVAQEGLMLEQGILD